MKIIQQTPTQLTTEDRPVFHWFMGILVGLQGIIVLVWTLSSPTSDTLSCTRTQKAQVNCELTTRLLLGQQNTRSIPNLQGASLNDASFLGSKTARASLITATDSIQLPVMPIWTAKSTVAQVNQFLKTPATPALWITENDQSGHFVGIISLPWILSGVYLLLLPIRTATFDKQMRQMRLKTQNLLGTKIIDQSISLPFSLEVKYYGRNYYLMLDKLSLSNFGDKKHLEEIASQIRDFLG